jgi:F-type H+-transporting ATPase subunit delta
MSAYRISQRYAKALLDLAEERGKTESVTGDVRMLNELLGGSRELRRLLHSPIVKMDRKLSVLEHIMKGRFEDETLAFVRILITKRRESFLHEIVRAFVDMYNERKGITLATLITPTPADNELMQEMTALIKEKFGKGSVELETKVDPSLIGGFVLRFDDKLYDSSVSTQLGEIRKELQSTTYAKN